MMRWFQSIAGRLKRPLNLFWERSQNNSAGEGRPEEPDGPAEPTVQRFSFGNLNNSESEFIKSSKTDAWKLVYNREMNEENDENNREKQVLQRYEEAINGIREQLGDEFWRNWRSDDYRKMLIKDGCFFLQLALFILGCSNTDLGYIPDHIIFSQENYNRRNKRWIADMFHIDNQISLPVLHILMGLTYFDEILSTRTFSPSSLFESALYELLVLPYLSNRRNSQARRSRSSEFEDILHGLQILLIFGPKDHLSSIKHEIKVHLDTNPKDQQVVVHLEAANSGMNSQIGLCVSNLCRSGICIKKFESGGIRRIKFKTGCFFAKLYLPTFSLDDSTEKILQNLIWYERQHFKYPYQREVSSYIKFMSGIVHTKKDAKFLHDRKIILGNIDQVRELPGILKRLALSQDGVIVMTPELQTVEKRIRDYNPWAVFKGLFSLMLILTFLQTVVSWTTYVKTFHGKNVP